MFCISPLCTAQLAFDDLKEALGPTEGSTMTTCIELAKMLAHQPRLVPDYHW